MKLSYTRTDALGLYLRFGSDIIVSFSPQSWGGVYYGATSVSEVDRSARSTLPVAFDIHPGEPVPFTSLANILHEPEDELRRQVEPELVRLGWTG